MQLVIRSDAKNKRVMKLVSQLEKRIAGIIRTTPRDVAKGVFKTLMATAPGGIPGYPDLLRVEAIRVSGGASVVGIVGDAKPARIKAAEVPRTVLYIQPVMSAKGEASSEAAALLASLNPWTVDTLPWEPSRREANVITRNVTEREVRRIEQRRSGDLTSVVAELRRLGVTIRPRSSVPPKRKVVRDVAFEVLRREFGIEIQGQAHWRPAIRAASRAILRSVLKRRRAWLTMPGNAQWKRPLGLPFGSMSQVRDMQRFQRMVAKAAGR